MLVIGLINGVLAALRRDEQSLLLFGREGQRLHTPDARLRGQFEERYVRIEGECRAQRAIILQRHIQSLDEEGCLELEDCCWRAFKRPVSSETLRRPCLGQDSRGLRRALERGCVAIKKPPLFAHE